MSRVLLTGATGFVGRNALAPLRERGFEVHAVSRSPGPDAADAWHRADLLEPGEAERVLAEVRPSHLLHLAWFAVHREYWRSTENLRWVEASLRLLRGFRESGGERAVLAGTCAEYDWSHGRCVEGETPLRPRGLYGVAKDALRRVVEAYAAETGLSAAWGRIFFLYGPHEHRERLVASTALALLRGDPAEATDGRQARDFLHVEDAASALAALLDSFVEGAVNVGSGEARAVRELVAALGQTAGRPELVRLGARAAAPGEPSLLVADVRRLREEVGWSPRRSLEQGLAETLAWWRAAAGVPVGEGAR